MKICLGIGIVCFVITVAMFAGCVEKGDAPVAMPTSTSVETSTQQQIEERAVVKNWMEMHNDADAEPLDDAIDAVMKECNRLGVRPVKAYRGSLIFRSDRYGSAGYIHIAEMDEDRLVEVGINETAYKELVQKKGGSYFWLDDSLCSLFPNLSGAEDFLAELWMPRFNETATMTNRSTASLPLEKPPFID